MSEKIAQLCEYEVIIYNSHCKDCVKLLEVLKKALWKCECMEEKIREGIKHDHD